MNESAIELLEYFSQAPSGSEAWEFLEELYKHTEPCWTWEEIEAGKLTFSDAFIGLVMSNRVETILSRARDTLADPNGERWSNDRLLRLLSEAQEDIVIHNELLRTTVDIPLVVGQSEYELPDDCYRIIRATVENRQIPIVSHDHMDDQSKRDVFNDSHYEVERSRNFSVRNTIDGYSLSWEDDTGNEVEAIVYDDRDPAKIKVYPVPNEDIAQAEYTFQNANTVEYVGDEMLGLVTDIETEGLPNYTMESPYGVLTSLYDPIVPTEILESIDGVVTQINEVDGFVRIWYTQSALLVTAISDQLIIPAFYDKALKYYVIAHAYDDDYDTGNQAKSAKFLQLYEREFRLATKFSETGGVRSQVHRTAYRSAFE